MKGTIKRVLSGRGYGFIEAEGEENDIFFHSTQTKDDFYTLREGDIVEFEIEQTNRGPQAVDVTFTS
jgi:CspA family cold shock protein